MTNLWILKKFKNSSLKGILKKNCRYLKWKGYENDHEIFHNKVNTL